MIGQTVRSEAGKAELKKHREQRKRKRGIQTNEDAQKIHQSPGED